MFVDSESTIVPDIWSERETKQNRVRLLKQAARLADEFNVYGLPYGKLMSYG